MGTEIFIPIIFFAVIFGIVYLLVSARNRERLALIEKGVDASIFYSKHRSITPMWKIIVVNFALLLMGIGLGIFIAAILHFSMGVDQEVAYPGTIFLMAGAGLMTGVYLTKKMNKEV